MQRRTSLPSSVFCPGCSVVVILGDHFQRCCSSRQPLHQSASAVAAARSSAAAHTLAARVHPPTPLSFTLRDKSAPVLALLPPMQRQYRNHAAPRCFTKDAHAKAAFIGGQDETLAVLLPRHQPGISAHGWQLNIDRISLKSIH